MNEMKSRRLTLPALQTCRRKAYRFLPGLGKVVGRKLSSCRHSRLQLLPMPDTLHTVWSTGALLGIRCAGWTTVVAQFSSGTEVMERHALLCIALQEIDHDPDDVPLLDVSMLA